MAGGKLSPRQQMINMMYLVLTALLALNVSKEILDSFITIDRGQNESRQSVEGVLSAQMFAFQERATQKPEKYGAKFKEAEKIQKAADDLVSYINRIKAKTISESEARPIEEVYDARMDTVLGIKYIKGKDNVNANTNIMYGITEEPAVGTRDGDEENYRATELRAQLEAFRNLIIAQSGENTGLVASVTKVFNYDPTSDSEGKVIPWEEMNFFHVPLAATTSILSKLQSDVRKAQSDAIGNVFDSVEGKSLKFTKLKDAVIPISTDVTAGGSYEADVFLAAYDDTNPPEIRLGNPGVKLKADRLDLDGEYTVLEMDSNAMGKVKLPAGGIGQQHREGIIIFRPAGLPEVRKDFVIDYNVVAPTLVVSPSKMNVFYKGVDNPVTVGVPGFQDRDVTPTINGGGGTITRGSEGYVVRVSSGTECSISVSCKLPDGSSKSLGPAKFRVKSVPDPVPVFGGKGQGDATIAFNDLTASQGVAAIMKDFEFDLKFTVISFEISMSVGGQFLTKSSNSNRVTSEMSELLKRSKNGQKVFIEGIKAKGPDGTVRSLGSLAFKVVK